MQSIHNKIAAVGTINKDTIYAPNGKKHESFGGLLYTIIPLAQMLGNNFEILPIFNLGRDCKRNVIPILNRHPHIRKDYVNIVPQKNNHCRLSYSNREAKKEILKGGVPSLIFNNIRPALSCSMTIVNFISGRDVSLRTLEKFRKNYRGQIYMDIHSLTLGKRKSGERYFRIPVNWRRYCACADYLQLNRGEFELLSGETYSPESAKRFFSGFENGHLKALHITMGKQGSYLVYRPKSKIIARAAKTPPVKILRDTTGCGDVFGAAFIAAILKGRSIYSATCFANDRAARKCNFEGIESLDLQGPKFR